MDGPQIRQLIRDPDIISSMDENQARAWRSFIDVAHNSPGKRRHENDVTLVKNMLEAVESLGYRMSIKMHYLHAHLDTFPANLGQVSDEQGEPFHKNISTMEDRYRGRWDEHMMADSCWNHLRSIPGQKYSRRSIKSRFLPPPE